MSVAILAHVVCAFSLLLQTPQQKQPPEQTASALESILENLALRESRYANIDVEWHAIYRAVPHKHSLPRQLAFRQRNGRYVQQGELFHLDFTSSNAPGGAVTDRLICAFDGDLTLSLEEQVGGRTANIVTGRRGSYRRLNPHTLPISDRAISVPLAAWLRGDDEIRKHRGAKVDKRYRFVATSLGRDS